MPTTGFDPTVCEFAPGGGHQISTADYLDTVVHRQALAAARVIRTVLATPAPAAGSSAPATVTTTGAFTTTSSLVEERRPAPSATPDRETDPQGWLFAERARYLTEGFCNPYAEMTLRRAGLLNGC